MSDRCSQVLADSISGSNAPACPSCGSPRSIPTPLPCCESTGPASRISETSDLFAGTPWSPSTCSAVDFPVSRTASPAKGKARKMHVTCGPNSHAWCENSDPVGCLLRTSLASALPQPMRSLATWTRRATSSGRSWWVCTPSARTMSACGSALLPTITATDANARTYTYDRGDKTRPRLSLCGLMATLTARDWRSGKASAATHARNSRPLSEQIGGDLNPRWCDAYMGFPPDWTALDDESASSALGIPSAPSRPKRSEEQS